MVGKLGGRCAIALLRLAGYAALAHATSGVSDGKAAALAHTVSDASDDKAAALYGSHENVRATPQTLTSETLDSTLLGCFSSDTKWRLLAAATELTVLGYASSDMTQEICSSFCLEEGIYNHYRLQQGTECLCGQADIDFDLLRPSTTCDYKCGGNSLATCGGKDSFQLYSYEPTAQSAPKTPAVEPTTLIPEPVASSTARRSLQTTPTPEPVPVTTQPVAVTTQPVTATAQPVAATVAPTTAAPTVAVTTAPPTTAPVTVPMTVLLDLQPCVVTAQAIADTSASAGPYILDLFFKGYWSASQLVLIAPGDDLISLMTDSADANHGLCNAVFVALVPTTAQYAALQQYSKSFKVRIVYLESSDSANDVAVTTRLGIGQSFSGDILTPSFMGFTTAGAATTSILNPAVRTDPIGGGMFTRPVRVISDTSSVTTGTATRVAEYLDSSGTPITSDTFNSVGMMTWEGVDGLEELHMFVSIGWFDTGSWAWVHHMVEWATKGIFMGQRRFYLGAVVDDLFLKTPEFSYGAGGVDEKGELLNEGTEYRCSGANIVTLKGVQDSLNTQYGSNIVTEFAFNGAGILEKVESVYLPPYNETLVTTKGTKMTPPGLQSLVHPMDYLSATVPLLAAEFAAGGWDGDDLLAAVLSNLDNFYHQSHTLIHLSRDELQESDCNIEDGANAQIAVITGMFSSANYNWRSMVSPGITGLFNSNCLQSGANNLMKCYPGDNTYDGVNTGTSLLSSTSPYHSITTSTSTNGYAGAQIVPRFATFVYYNCVSGSCLVNENEYIRRVVCGCSELDPSLSRGTCSNVGSVNGCNSDSDITTFSTSEELFDIEAATTTRYLLSGRRDKYMFHQANVVPVSDLSGKSTLEYWYEKVMATFASFIAFPVTSTKFDDLCVNFQEHEDLDSSGALVTATVTTATGAITGMTLSSSGAAGLVPVTVPTASASAVSTGTLTPYSTETYGSDTTFYFATATGAQPTPAPQPSSSELAPLTISAAPVALPVSAPVEAMLEEKSEAAVEEAENIAAEEGFVVEEGGM